MSAAEANRRFYAETAKFYDTTETCVVEPHLRAKLRSALADAVEELPAGARVLDACGGSGNASLILMELGLNPVTVDVSPDMLAIFERRARSRGFSPATHATTIERFLENDPRTWDLVVFSSALHHLEDYAATLDLAIDRLAPGGLVLTMFDPTRAGRAGRMLRRFDYMLHVALKTPRRIPALAAARLVRRRRGDGGHGAIGAQAERYAVHGVDDVSLVGSLRKRGVDVVAHERAYEGRFAATRLAFRLLGEPSSFSLIVQRPREVP